VSTTRTPTLQEVFAAAMDARLEEVRVCVPARVESYDGTTQKADVQPLVKRRHEDEFGDLQVESLPVVPGVPVIFPGGGGFLLQFPVSAGDTGLLLFSADSIDKWLDQGGLVDPESHHRFSLSDGIFLPGLRPFSVPRLQSPSALVIGADGGMQVQVSQAEIKLGPIATDPLILSTPFLTAFATLIGVIATAAAGTGGGVTSAINAALAAFQAAAPGYLSVVAKTQ